MRHHFTLYRLYFDIDDRFHNYGVLVCKPLQKISNKFSVRPDQEHCYYCLL